MSACSGFTFAAGSARLESDGVHAEPMEAQDASGDDIAHLIMVCPVCRRGDAHDLGSDCPYCKTWASVKIKAVSKKRLVTAAAIKAGKDAAARRKEQQVVEAAKAKLEAEEKVKFEELKTMMSSMITTMFISNDRADTSL